MPYICPPLAFETAQQAPRAHHVLQQEMDAGEDVVLFVGTHLPQLAEIVQRYGHRVFAGVVDLEMGSGDAVIGREHGGHDVRGDGRLPNDRADQREQQDLSLEHGLDGYAALHFPNSQRVGPWFGDLIAGLRQKGVDLPQLGAGCGCHRFGVYSFWVRVPPRGSSAHAWNSSAFAPSITIARAVRIVVDAHIIAICNQFIAISDNCQGESFWSRGSGGTYNGQLLQLDRVTSDCPSPRLGEGSAQAHPL